MTSSTIPLPHGPHVTLDAHQREDLQRRVIKKHDTAVILLHWFNVAIWVVELATGGALLAGKSYQIAPEWWRTFVVSLLGSPAMVLKVHVTAGIVWTIVLLVYGIFGFRKYLVPTVSRYLIPDRDDLIWLRERGKLILGRPGHLPPQGVYNAGQKLFGIAVFAAGFAIIVSGFVMAYHLGPPWLIQWAILLHFVAVGGVFAGLFVHVYMGAVLPEERPAFYSMFSGKVPELYAYKHHYKWWREYKDREAVWREELEREVQADRAEDAARAGTTKEQP
jgi:formate dehydrogenase subunit gamma